VTVHVLLYGGAQDGAELDFPMAPPVVRVPDAATAAGHVRSLCGYHVYHRRTSEEGVRETGTACYDWKCWEPFVSRR